MINNMVSRSPRRSSILSCTFTLLILLSIPAQATEFFRLDPTLPDERVRVQGVSADGSMAIGNFERFVGNRTEPLQEAFRWQPGAPAERLGLGPAGNVVPRWLRLKTVVLWLVLIEIAPCAGNRIVGQQPRA